MSLWDLVAFLFIMVGVMTVASFAALWYWGWTVFRAEFMSLGSTDDITAEDSLEYLLGADGVDELLKDDMEEGLWS